MTNIVEKPELFPSVPLMEPGMDIKGGDETAPSNLQAVALAARTAYLKAEIDGMMGGGIHVIGTLADRDELDVIDTQPLSKGSGYFVGGALALWNGQEWIISGSLIGPPGASVDGISGDSDNALTVGEDGKLFVPNDISINLLTAYALAKE